MQHYVDVCKPYWDIEYAVQDLRTGQITYACAVGKTYDPKTGEYTEWKDLVLIPGDGFADVNATIRSMAKMGVVPCNNTKVTKQLAFDWAQHCINFNKSRPVRMTYDANGWNPDGSYTLGLVRWSPAGDVEDVEVVGGLDHVADALTTRGPVHADAQKILMETYRDHADATGKFMLVASLAAPLMAWTQSPRMMLSMVGPTGVGKTALQRMVTSFWGPPVASTIPASSTPAYMANQLAALRDIPVVIDEASRVQSHLAGVIYQNGDERGRLHQNGEAQKKARPWTGLLITSSNTSMFDTLHGLSSAEADAISARFLEVPVLQRTLPLAVVPEINRIHDLCYGWLGGQFMTELYAGGIERYQALLRMNERFWLEGTYIPNPSPKARMWLSFFAAMHATTVMLSGMKFCGQWDWPDVWQQLLLPLCKELYRHNDTQAVRQPVLERLAGIAAAMCDVEINETGPAPYPIGLQVARGSPPQTRRALVGGREVWTVHQRALQVYLEKASLTRPTVLSDLITDAKSAGAFIPPLSAGTATHMLALGTGPVAPSYQFYLT
jgi:hypothetical protein